MECVESRDWRGQGGDGRAWYSVGEGIEYEGIRECRKGIKKEFKEEISELEGGIVKGRKGQEHTA